MEWRSSIEPKRESAARDNVSTTSGRAREGERTAKKNEIKTFLQSSTQPHPPGSLFGSAAVALELYFIHIFNFFSPTRRRRRRILELVLELIHSSSSLSCRFSPTLFIIALYMLLFSLLFFSVCTINSFLSSLIANVWSANWIITDSISSGGWMSSPVGKLIAMNK